jgi:hypothetical protein
MHSFFARIAASAARQQLMLDSRIVFSSEWSVGIFGSLLMTPALVELASK